MKTKQIIVGTTLLIFSPEKFSEYATKAGIEQEFRDSKQLRERHPNGEAPPEVVAEWKKHNLDRANSIRGSHLSSNNFFINYYRHDYWSGAKKLIRQPFNSHSQHNSGIWGRHPTFSNAICARLKN